MKTRHHTLLIAALLCVGAAAAAEPLRVAASIAPLADFVEHVGGDRVAVTVAVPPGASPATHDPTPKHRIALSGARLFFATGVPMERLLLSRLEGPRVIDTAAGLELRALADHDHHDHDHPGHEHHHHGEESPDPHVWLDPMLAAAQVRTIAAALAAEDPAGADLYHAAAEAYAAELEALDAELRALLEPVRGRKLHVFHPSFGYFAATYGLEQVAIEQGGLDPSPRHLTRVLTDVRESGSRAVFTQPQFSAGAANAVAKATGVELVELDPLARDYVPNLRFMARTIVEALE